MRNYFDTVFDATTSRPLVGASVRVLEQAGQGEPAGDVATIYSDDNGTIIANPLPVQGADTESPGFYRFYAEDGFYTLQYLYAGQVIKTITDVDISADVTRAELADDSGAGAVGTEGGGTVQESLNAIGPVFETFSSSSVAGNIAFTSGAVSAGDGGDSVYAVDPSQDDLTARGETIASWGELNGLNPLTAATRVGAAERRFRRADSEGRYFTLSQREHFAQSFRLTADTDATWLQAFADYLSCWLGVGEIGRGYYTLDDTVFVTRGPVVDGAPAYTRSIFRGAGRGFFGDVGFYGTELTFTATDRPGLIVQGGRHVIIRDLGLTGPLKSHILDNRLGEQISAVDETDPDEWNGPCTEERWAPVAAVACDPLAGTKPADPYPDFGSPDWLGDEGLDGGYGRPTTSVVDVDDVNITGWMVGLMVNSSNSAVQTDFVTMGGGNVECCKWGFSVGNSQSRQTEFKNVRFNRVYCAITNRHHGNQGGQLSTTFLNISVGGAIKVYDLIMTLAGTTSFQNLYVEQALYLGDIATGGSTDSPLRHEGLLTSFWQADLAMKTGSWPYILGNPDQPSFGNTTAPVSFVDALIQVRHVCPLMVTKLRCDSLTINCSEAQSAAPSIARAMAQNGTLGLVTPLGARSHPHIIQSQYYDLDSGAGSPNSAGTARTDSAHRQTARQYCVPYWLQKAIPANHSDDLYAVSIPQHNSTVPKANFTFGGTPVTGRTLTMTGVSGADENNARYYCQAPGRVFLDTQSGIWWYVESYNYTTGAVVAKALCGYRDPTGVNDGANDELYIPWNASGSFVFIETGFYTPVEVLLGDTTSGNAVISNVRSPSGATAWFVNQIEAGDFLWVDPNDTAPLFPLASFKNKVASVNDGAQTITMNGNATATTTGTRFALWQRQI